MILSLASLLIGMVLGQRFKAAILFPVTGVVLALAAGDDALRGLSFWPAALRVVAAVIVLQVGYFIGLLIRHLLAGDPLMRVPPARLSRHAPSRRAAH